MLESKAQDLPRIDLLTDFIYIDDVKVRYFLAQLFRAGVLTQFKEEKAYTDSYKTNVGLNKIAVAQKESVLQDSNKLSYEYDTYHSLPSLLLDALSENNFIKKDILQAENGNLVLISGSYRIFDVGLLEKLMPIAKLFKNDKKAPKDRELNAMTEALKMLPKNLQIDLVDSHQNCYWASLKKENLLVNIEDILLSSGNLNKDEWFVLGILENRPNEFSEPIFDDMKSQLSGVYDSMRRLFGRPDDSFSVTPVLIFRKILK